MKHIISFIIFIFIIGVSMSHAQTENTITSVKSTIEVTKEAPQPQASPSLPPVYEEAEEIKEEHPDADNKSNQNIDKKEKNNTGTIIVNGEIQAIKPKKETASTSVNERGETEQSTSTQNNKQNQ